MVCNLFLFFIFDALECNRCILFTNTMMHNRRQFLISLTVVALLSSSVSLCSYRCLSTQQTTTITNEPTVLPQAAIQLASLSADASPLQEPNFVYAAQLATPAVVHIKARREATTTSMSGANSPLDRLLREFFGEGLELGPREYKSPSQQATGSGVLIAADGYIVTNNHVIDGADQIEVTLDDNRRYTAQLVGQDADTDLALLKINEQQLPYLQFGNSDRLQVGEWILAVGNPFNLTSTVTKGIVSAKARNINVLQDKSNMRIEAFIQTDAAVNPGNSGGALVTLNGELVGINTAIATPTGAFAGYSFAIPSSIVKKITNDLKKYGTVQRAMLGIAIKDVDADLAEKEGLQKLSGVYVAAVHKKGAAAEAGLQAGDVIVAINNHPIKNTSQLQEQIAMYKPDDAIQVTFYRKAQERTATVKLKNVMQKVQLARNGNTVEIEGAVFEPVDQATQQKLKLAGGVYLKTLKAGPWKRAGIKQGLIVTAIDREAINNLDQLVHIVQHKEGGILVEGFYPNGVKAYYGVDLDN